MNNISLEQVKYYRQCIRVVNEVGLSLIAIGEDPNGVKEILAPSILALNALLPTPSVSPLRTLNNAVRGASSLLNE